MKRGLVLIAIAFAAFGCGSADQKPQATNNIGANSDRASRVDNSGVASSHSEPMSTPMVNSAPPLAPQKPESSSKPEGQSNMASGGNPIDTAAFDAEIAKAEKVKGDAGKKELASAYFKRAVALTEARQYASALGDYRRCLKNDPDNDEAKSWVVQIIAIYKSLKKDAPEEGKEPPPLPFKKPETKT